MSHLDVEVPSLISEEGTTQETGEGRIWTKWQVSLGALLFGPFVGPFLLSRNAKALGNPQLAKRLLFYGFLLSTAALVIIHTLPEAWLDKVPSFLFSLSYMLGSQTYFQARQQADVHTFLKKEGHGRHSFWKLLFISIPLAALTFVWGIVLATFIEMVRVGLG